MNTAQDIAQTRAGALRGFKPAQAMVFTGLAMVLLPTGAVLANAALGNVQVPAKLVEIATSIHFWLVFAAVPLAMVQIALPKGTFNHRLIGYVWCALLLVSAVASFAMHDLTGGFSPPHAFSIATLFLVPMIVYFARSHRVAWHRGMVLLLCGLMILAGLLTFLPGRVIGTMLWAMIG